jgi:hypothetical protein
MGYNTSYSLEVLNTDDLTDDQRDAMWAETVDGDYTSLYDLAYNPGNLDDMKWYSHEGDMRRISSKYPNVLFVLGGEGEESGDIWKAWFRNGVGIKVEAEILVPEPDLTKLPMLDMVNIKRRLAEDKRDAARRLLQQAQKEYEYWENKVNGE